MTDVKKKQGHSTLAAMQGLLGKEVEPKDIKTIDVVFVEKNLRNGNKQLFSMLTTTEGGIKVLPLLSRFKPKPGKKYKCHVLFRENPQGEIVGYALPVSLHKLSKAEWLPVEASVLTTTFRRIEDGNAKFVGHANNGKKVLIFDEGFEPAVGREISVLVAEYIACFIAYGEAPQHEGKVGKEGTMALVIRDAEAAGAVIQAVDPYMVVHGNLQYDACEVLGADREAPLAEIKRVGKKLLAEAHPDLQTAKFRKTMGRDPDAETEEEYQDAFKLIQECRDRLMVVAQQREADQKYAPRGRGFKKGGKASSLANKLKVSLSELLDTLDRIGFGVSGEEAFISPRTAQIVSGYLAVQADEQKERESGASAV